MAGAIGRGLRGAGRPVDLCPVADGGEGTLDALAAGLGAERRHADTTDPLERPVHEFGFSLVRRGHRGHRGASGLGLVTPAE